MSKKSLASKLRLPSESAPKSNNMKHVYRRRSKSACDLRSTNNKGTRTLKRKSVAPQEISADRLIKRLADVKSEEKEVSQSQSEKPVKPARYNYKGRYNMLKDEHIKLKAKFLGMKVEIENVSFKINNYNEMEKRLQELKKINDIISIQTEEISQANTRMKYKYEILESEHRALTKRYDHVLETLRNVEKVYDYITIRNTKAEEDLKVALTDIAKRDELIDNLKTRWAEMDEMRRRLHNEIQNLKGNIRVFCRMRPLKYDERHEQQCIINCTNECCLTIRRSKDAEGRLQELVGEFSFDHVFLPFADQQDVFKELSPLIQSALDGYNVCIFAYGQTGSGKTYTMQGVDKQEGLGIIPRAFDHLFQCIAHGVASGWKFKVTASFLEIYNENIKDLLNPENDTQHDIRFNDGRGITITNLTDEIITSAQELKHLMNIAQRNRATAATNFNEHSSRSHAVTKVTLESYCQVKSTIYFGSLNFVDLAGSECAKTSAGTRLSETKYINKSLSALGNVMMALHNKSSYVPYRNSKLTYMLQSSLGGNSKTLMFVNISPLDKAFCESINSLRFAAQVKEVKTTVKRNKCKSPV